MVSPTTAVSVAIQKSFRLVRQSSTIAPISMSPMTATKTSEASVACGRRLSTGPRNRATSTASTTVVSEASCERAPAPWFTALCEKPPAAGSVWKKAPRVFAAPVANSSRLLSICGSPGLRMPRATAADSRNAMTAIASAPGSMPPRCAKEGSSNGGKPCGTAAISSTPSRSMPASQTSRMPATTTTSGPGTRFAKRLSRNSTTIEPADSSTVGRFAPGSASTAATIERRKPCPLNSASSPSSFGSWPTATVAPTPTCTPMMVAFEMYSTAEPAFSSRASSRSTPTRSVSAIRSGTGSSEPAATPALTSVVAVSVAIVEVVDTLIAREPPSIA